MSNKGKIRRVRGSLGLLVAVQFLVSTNAYSQDDLASRRAAAERYEATMPIVKMMEDSIQQMTLSLPNDQRNIFVTQMGQVVDGQQLRTIALDTMVEVFSAEELDALAAFYGSPVGQTIVTKFPVYIAKVMPAIELQLARAIRELKNRSR
jgi:hypothetical protein